MNKVLRIIIFAAVLISMAFLIWFSVGMKESNSEKKIITQNSNDYKANMMKDFPSIQKIDIYYRQGKIYFKILISPEMNLEECKDVVKKTKTILEKKGLLNLLPEGYTGQETIIINFNDGKDAYSFRSPYFIQEKDNTSKVNLNYKIWYMTLNQQQETQIDF